MNRTVVIAGSADLELRSFERYTTVAIDVIRATTTAITAAARGRRCFPVRSILGAKALAARLPGALLAGEQRGFTPEGFDLTNSPAEVDARADIERPLVLLSSSGTKLVCDLAGTRAVHLACFRNWHAVAARLAAEENSVAVLGALTNDDFREEDQMCCAWIAEALIADGFVAEDLRTRALVQRWSRAPRNAFTCSPSVAYLRRSGQERDLDFVLEHFEDVDATFTMEGGELVQTPLAPRGKAAAG